MNSLQELIARFAIKDAEAAYYQPGDQLFVDARDTFVDDDDLTFLAGFECLVCLQLTGTKITNRSIPLIAKFPRLEQLALGRTACDERCLESLMELVELKSLELSGMLLATCFEDLFQFQKLQVLDLSNTGVTKNEVRTLIQLTNIKLLHLSGNGFQTDDFTDLDMLVDNYHNVHIYLDEEVSVCISRPNI